MTLLMMGGIVIAVAARRLLRPDTAARSAIKRDTGYWRADERRGSAIDYIPPCRSEKRGRTCLAWSCVEFLLHEICTMSPRIYIYMQLYRAIRTRTERRLSIIQPGRLNYSVLSRFIGGRDFSSIFQASWRSVL